MKKSNLKTRKSQADSELLEDVQDLLETSVIAEATDKVWERFEHAMGEMDPASLEIITRYFRGESAATISRDKGLSEDEVQAWLTQAKRELIHFLRSSNRPVKQ